MKEHFEPKRVASYLFIVVIAVLFTVTWGPGSSHCGDTQRALPSEAAATVNGKEVPMKDFLRLYSNQTNYFRAQGLPASFAKQMGLHTQVLTRLVDAELLAQAAEREGIAASDNEVLEVLKKDPNFHKEGTSTFDYETYRRVLRDFYRRTDVDFEGELRRQLAAQKLSEMVEAGANVSDDEVKAKFLKEGDKANATVVRFLPAMFINKVGAAKPAELAAFIKDHAKEIADNYEANKYLYNKPEQVRARQILIKFPEGATPEQKAEAKTKIENLKKELDGGKDFAALATQSSEDVNSKDKGGDLGFNERGAWPPAFAEAAFKLEAGKVSDPVETTLGWHLVKVEEKKPAETKALKDVENEIAQRLWTKEQGKKLAEAEAKKALEAAKSGKKLTELFPKKTPDPKNPTSQFEIETTPEAAETGEFDSSVSALPILGAAPELHKEIFALQGPAVISHLHPSGEGFAVVAVTDRHKATEAEFTEKKDTLRTEAIKGKQFELRSEYLKALKKQGTVTLHDAAVNKALGDS
jgi:peptidyl-prolyl cis-trans isomerase D